MQRLWNLLYSIEIIAALSVLVSLGLRWHTDYGTGLGVLEYAFSRKAEMMYLEYGTTHIGFSSRMMVALIPILAFFWGIRAALARITGGTGRGNFVRLGLIIMLIVPVWFWLSNEGQLLSGFWVCLVSLVLLTVSVGMEFNLPVDKPRRKTLQELIFETQQPTSDLITCPQCGGMNPPLARNCIYCGFLFKAKK